MKMSTCLLDSSITQTRYKKKEKRLWHINYDVNRLENEHDHLFFSFFFFCMKRCVSQGVRPCKPCPPSTAPSVGLQLQWWGAHLPPFITTRCMSLEGLIDPALAVNLRQYWNVCVNNARMTLWTIISLRCNRRPVLSFDLRQYLRVRQGKWGNDMQWPVYATGCRYSAPIWDFHAAKQSFLRPPFSLI